MDFRSKRESKKMSTSAIKIMPLSQVKETPGLSESTIYARIAEGIFPKQIPLGPRLVVLV